MVRNVVALTAALCLTVAVQAQPTVQPQPQAQPQPQNAVQVQSVRGVVRSVDGNMLTMMVGNTERKIQLAPNVRVFTTQVQGGRLRRRQQVVLVELANGMANVQPNSQVLATTEIRDGREVVTQIRLEGTVGPIVVR